MDAAAAAGAERYVMVSYFGAGPDHGVPPENDFYAYAQAKTEADAHLEESALKWTILQPSALTEGPPADTVDVQASDAGQVSRGTVARMIRAVAGAEPAAVAGLKIPFNDGDTPIDDALRHVR